MKVGVIPLVKDRSIVHLFCHLVRGRPTKGAGSVVNGVDDHFVGKMRLL